MNNMINVKNLSKHNNMYNNDVNYALKSSKTNKLNA